MRYLISIFISLLVLALPLCSSAKELEQGGARLGVDYQILRSESSFFSTTDYETDLYIDLWQNTVNFGTLELDVLYALIEKDLDPDSWNALFAVRDFYVGKTTMMDLELGDTAIRFRTIPHFFSIYYLPVAYFRGINSEIRTDIWKLKYFFGWGARRRGFLGTAFTRTDQMIYGFNFGAELPRNSFIGVGFMRGQDEKDFITDDLIMKYNNIFIADARLGIYGDLSILGEYLHSFYNSETDGKKNDYSLIVGPYYENEKALVEANYRKYGKDFRFINNQSPTVTNQEGVFVRGNLSLREEHKIYLYGSGNYFWDDPEPGSGRNRLYTLYTNLGATFFPVDKWYFSSTFSVTKKDASGMINPVDDLLYNAFFGFNVDLAQRKVGLYTKLRYAESRINYPEKNISRQPEGRIGVNWRVHPRLDMNFEGQVRKDWDTRNLRDLLWSNIRYYLYWRPRTRVNVRPSVEYVRVDDGIRHSTSNGLNLGINYSQQFNRGWRISTSFQWEKVWGLSSSSYFNGHLNFEKTFRWGRPVLRKGKHAEKPTYITGNIAGYIFVDENKDGLMQPWEKGIADIPVRLGTMFVEHTDGKGRYEFQNVIIGKQKVEVMVGGLDMKYNLMFHREDVDVRLRQTAELNFPVTLVN